MFARSLEWVEKRLALRPAAAKVLDKPVSPHVTWLHCFGGLTFFAFLIQVATGIILLFFYVPSPDHAYDSVSWFQEQVPFGSIVRSLHLWGAYAMVILVFLHTLRVMVHGAYRRPRELNWVLGMGLLLLVLAAGFTGYLLPWDQKAFWATSVGLNILEDIPLLGPLSADLLRGGPSVGALTLLRFYALHVAVLPLLLAAGMVLHFAMIRKQGIAKPL